MTSDTRINNSSITITEEEYHIVNVDSSYKINDNVIDVESRKDTNIQVNIIESYRNYYRAKLQELTPKKPEEFRNTWPMGHFNKTIACWTRREKPERL